MLINRTRFAWLPVILKHVTEALVRILYRDREHKNIIP